jgi:hypothetical protein
MADQNVVDPLNRLLALHSRSLPMYLASAQPWFPELDSDAERVLRHLADDQRMMVDQIGAVILDIGGLVQPSEFPMEFTDLHDLSIEYLLPLVAARQQEELGQMRQIAHQVRHHPTARAVAEEALGAAPAHLDNLREIGAQPARGASA